MKNLRVAVVYSVPIPHGEPDPAAATDEDTFESARQVFRVLSESGVDPRLVPIKPQEIERIRTIQADCIFNLIEWSGVNLPFALQAFEAIEASGLPFTGATRKNFRETGDKILMKKVLGEYKVRTPVWQAFAKETDRAHRDFHYPVIVKLAWEHCSVGISSNSVVYNETQLFKQVQSLMKTFTQPVVAEEFIKGREFHVTLVEINDRIRVLPPAEIIFAPEGSVDFLTYESRWNEAHADYHSSGSSVTDLPAQLLKKIEEFSLKTFQALGFRDYARFDLRVKNDDIYLLEPNANPGLDESLEYQMTKSLKAAGMTFADLVINILVSSLKRFKREAMAKRLARFQF